MEMVPHREGAVIPRNENYSETKKNTLTLGPGFAANRDVTDASSPTMNQCLVRTRTARAAPN